MSKGRGNTRFWLLASLMGGTLTCSLLGALDLLLPMSLVGATVLAGAGMGLLLWMGRTRSPHSEDSVDTDFAELGRKYYETAIKVSYAGRLSRDAILDILEKTESLVGSCGRLRTQVGRVKQVSTGTTSEARRAPSSAAESRTGWVVEDLGRPLGPMLQEVMSTVREMAVVLREVDHNAKELITSTEETAYSMSRLDSFLQDMANNGRDLEASTDTANRVALEGTKVVGEMGRENEAIITTVNEAASAVEDLGRWSQEVGKIVEVIRDIADETNLLALNASIIAAQSGEHGKAFGVVAEEIRGLAERTSSSTKEISDLVKAVQKNVANVVNSMKKSLQRVERGELLTRNAGMVLEKVFESFESSRNLAKEIASSTFEHKIDSSQVVRSLHKVTDIARRLQSHNCAGWTGAGETLGMARALNALCEQPSGMQGAVPTGGLDGKGQCGSGLAPPGEIMISDLEKILSICDSEIGCYVDSLARTRDNLDSRLRSLEEVSRIAATGLGPASVGGASSDSGMCWDIVRCDHKLREQCPAYKECNGRLFFSQKAACTGWTAQPEEEKGENGSSQKEAGRVDHVAHEVGSG